MHLIPSTLLALLAAYLTFSVLVAVTLVVVWGTPYRQPVRTRAEDLGPGARRIDFRSSDGARLVGYFVPGYGESPLLMIQAGRRGTRDHLLPWARVLADSGYGVFTFDWRAQGESEGRVLSYGAHGAADMAGALQALGEQPEAAGRPVGIYACSLGAACVAMSAKDLPDFVQCMILDSPYGDLHRMVRHKTRRLGPLLLLPRLLIELAALALLRKNLRRIVPEQVLEAFSPRPLMVFHGDRDTTIPFQEGRSLFERYPGPKRFWSSPDAHVDARITRTKEWMEHLARFFAEHLPGAPDPEVVLARTPVRLDEPG